MMGRGTVTTRFLMLPSNPQKRHCLLPCLNLVMTRLWSCSHILTIPLFKSITTYCPCFQCIYSLLLGYRWFLLWSKSQQKTGGCCWSVDIVHCRVGNCVVMNLYSRCHLGTMNDVWTYWLYLDWLVAFWPILFEYSSTWQGTCKYWFGVRWKNKIVERSNCCKVSRSW